MAEPDFDRPSSRRRFPLPTLAASFVFVLGFVLATTVNGGFFLLAAVGALLPTLLRDWGLLRDHDEFQRLASARAATHGYLIATLFAAGVLAVKSWGVPFGGNRETELWLVLFSVVLGGHFVSYAWRFWDARKAAPRILAAFGLFWLLFVVLSHWQNPAALAVEGLTVAAPFFLMAALARRFPRTVGLLLLALTFAAGRFFHVFPPGPRGWNHALVLSLFLLLPLALTGVSLLRVRSDPTD